MDPRHLLGPPNVPHDAKLATLMLVWRAARLRVKAGLTGVVVIIVMVAGVSCIWPAPRVDSTGSVKAVTPASNISQSAPAREANVRSDPAPCEVGKPTEGNVIPGAVGMTAPTLVQPAPIVYTREAWEAKSEGILVARCTLTADGELTNCQIVRGLPHLDDAVLTSLKSWKYTPALCKGQPFNVQMTIPIRLRRPDSAPRLREPPPSRRP
jgi:TonB family protein